LRRVSHPGVFKFYKSDSVLGFNQETMVSDPTSIAKVAASPGNGQNATTPYYEPLVQLGPSIAPQFDKWTKSFPKDYPQDRTAFLNGAQSKTNVSKAALSTARRKLGEVRLLNFVVEYCE
jgi:hypothetical protein